MCVCARVRHARRCRIVAHMPIHEFTDRACRIQCYESWRQHLPDACSFAVPTTQRSRPHAQRFLGLEDSLLFSDSNGIRPRLRKVPGGDSEWSCTNRQGEEVRWWVWQSSHSQVQHQVGFDGGPKVVPSAAQKGWTVARWMTKADWTSIASCPTCMRCAAFSANAMPSRLPCLGFRVARSPAYKADYPNLLHMRLIHTELQPHRPLHTVWTTTAQRANTTATATAPARGIPPHAAGSDICIGRRSARASVQHSETASVFRGTLSLCSHR